MSQSNALLIHHEPQHQKRLARLLAELGHEVTIASSSEEAFALIERRAFQLVIAPENGASSPGFGFSALSLRARGARVVAIVSPSDLSAATRAGRAGADACLSVADSDVDLARALARLGAECLPVTPEASSPRLGGDFTLDEIEREHIERVVARAPSYEAAARVLGIDDSTLWRKRKRFASRPPKRATGQWAS